MRKFFIGLFMVILAAGSLAAEKTTVAFVGLEASGVSEASASGIADTLLDALINTKRFEIVERDRLNALMEEQGLALSGCTTTECFVQVGQLAGASKVVVGKVSKVGETYTVTVRVVDVFVGKVELSESSESSSLDGLLVASREMAARLAASIPVVGTVVSVSGETVKLDLGRQEGVNVGDKVELYRLGEEYYHPDTGAFLGRDIEELGDAKITRVLADELSEAEYTGDTPPVTGDKARLGGRAETGGHEAVTTATTHPTGKGGRLVLSLGGLAGVAINDPYGAADVEGWTEGVRIGGRVKFDYFFSPYFGIGLYTSLLSYLDSFEATGYYSMENAFLELILGLGFKVYFIAEGTFRPWFEAGAGYAMTSVDMVREDSSGEYYPYGSGGSIGVEGGLGADLFLSKGFGIGIGALVHYNATDLLESDEWSITLDPTPLSVEGALDLVIVF
jgi:hypothetical protein